MVSKKKRPWSSPLKSPGQGHRDTKSSIIPTPSSERNTSTSQCPVRIRSATLYRDKVPQPTRPITAVTDQNSDQEQELIFSDEHHSELERSLTRPVTPVPFANDINETFCELEESIKLQTSPSPNEDDYEKIVDSYGWRAQIHGDPYQLKRPMKRESYVVNCTVAKPLPDPPVVYMETKEPFFYNTIPRKPLSFSVDREWMSEVLVAKRLDLQKRESGIKYNYKNFAFVY